MQTYIYDYSKRLVRAVAGAEALKINLRTLHLMLPYALGSAQFSKNKKNCFSIHVIILWEMIAFARLIRGLATDVAR